MLTREELDHRRCNNIEPRWVIGVVDAYGSVINVRATESWRDSPTHTPEDRMAGRPWRWNVWGQDFFAVLDGSTRMNRDDYRAVRDYLEREGYAIPDEDILLEKRQGTLLAVDRGLMKVGCPLLQATLGGNSTVVSFHFHPADWVVHPTDGLQLYSFRPGEVDRLVKMFQRLETIK